MNTQKDSLREHYFEYLKLHPAPPRVDLGIAIHSATGEGILVSPSRRMNVQDFRKLFLQALETIPYPKKLKNTEDKESFTFWDKLYEFQLLDRFDSEESLELLTLLWASLPVDEDDRRSYKDRNLPVKFHREMLTLLINQAGKMRDKLGDDTNKQERSSAILAAFDNQIRTEGAVLFPDIPLFERQTRQLLGTETERKNRLRIYDFVKETMGGATRRRDGKELLLRLTSLVCSLRNDAKTQGLFVSIDTIRRAVQRRKKTIRTKHARLVRNRK